MILLEHPESGERCLTESAEGYEGWRVVAEDVPPPPNAHCRWVEHEQRWRTDPEQRLRAENLAAMGDREALLVIIEGLMAEIAELKERLP